MKKFFLVLLCSLIFLGVIGCGMQNIFDSKFTITEINGIGEEYKIHSGTGICSGNLTEIDSFGNVKCYNLCKVEDFKITKIVEDNIGGTNYLFIHYDLTSSLIDGEIGVGRYGVCHYTLEVYDINGNKLEKNFTDQFRVTYTNFNTAVTSSGIYKAPINGNTYSIKVVAY